MHDDPLKIAGHRLRSSLKQVQRIRTTQVQANKSLSDTQIAIDASKRLLARADKLLLDWRNFEDPQ